jgi:hypothetical protein
MTRYAEPQYGENAIATGIFSTGDVVTIKVVDLTTGAVVPINDGSCTELVAEMPGLFIWDSSDPLTTFDTPPTDLNLLIWRMRNAMPFISTWRMATPGRGIGSAPRGSRRTT